VSEALIIRFGREGQGWTPHESGPNPAPGDTVDVLFRDGGTNSGMSDRFLGWVHEPLNGSAALRHDDIIAYIVTSPKRGSFKRPYNKSARWHAAKERRRSAPRLPKADAPAAPDATSTDPQPGTKDRNAGRSEVRG